MTAAGGCATAPFSVVICVHNGCARLGRSLDALALAQPRPAQILLVDNASTDGSAAFAAARAERLGLELELIAEPRPGLAQARLAGLAAARAPLVCFVDDDNHVAPDYFARAEAAFAREPRLGLLGGFTRLPQGYRLPDWWPQFQAGFAVGAQHPASGLLPRGSALWGAGLCLRRAAIEPLLRGAWSPQLSGRLGAQALSGDDSELCLAVQLLGWRAAYDDSLQLEHAIAPERMQPQLLLRMFRAYGATQPVLRCYDLALYREPGRLAVLIYLLLRLPAWQLQALRWSWRAARAARRGDDTASLRCRCAREKARGAVWALWRGMSGVARARRNAQRLRRLRGTVGAPA